MSPARLRACSQEIPPATGGCSIKNDSDRSVPHKTTSSEEEFARELEIFRTEAEAGAQYFYSYLAVHELAKRYRRVFRTLDENALFWNTLLGGLQTEAIMTIGRIFDRRSPHNVNTLMRLASQHRSMFSKVALGRRKQGTEREPPAWLPDYLLSAYEPTENDLRCLADHVKKYRRIYEDKYVEEGHGL